MRRPLASSVDGGGDDYGGICQPDQGAKPPGPHRDDGGGGDDKPPIIGGLTYRGPDLVSKAAQVVRSVALCSRHSHNKI
jgi:hypothetical protein